MKSNAPAVIALALLVGLLPAAGHGAVGDYSQDFEVLIQTDPDALANDGSLVFGHESAPDGAGLGVSFGQDYPDPFNPLIRIVFTLERPGHGELVIDDLAGRRVAVLQQGELGTGTHHVTWDNRDAFGAPALNGQYRCVLTTPSGRVARSMVPRK